MLNQKQLNYITREWAKIYGESLKHDYSGFYNILKKEKVK
jgi:hypothetical protein|tara:strand:- start:775 stop:894 length:120 start_codon:yes stop_codon:yes gene_type:complete